MDACAKQKAKPFKQDEFKANVNDYYSITTHRSSKDYSWCHILGRFLPATIIRAAHIVPKSITQPELAHMFGSDDPVTAKPCNVLSLQFTVEKLLDEDAIIVIPVPGEPTKPTTWRMHGP